MNAACNLCGSQTRRLTVAVGIASFTRVPGEYSITECPQCGLCRTEPIPGPEELLRHYERFGPHLESEVSQSAFSRLEQIRRGTLMGLLYRLAYRFTRAPVAAVPRDTGPLLDIGCGSGNFAVRMQALGLSATGQDSFLEAGSQARDRGIDVFIGPLEDMAAERRGQFQCVTAWHVVEHVPDARSFLGAVYDLLDVDGTFVMEVPNVDSWERHCLGVAWWAWMPPLHLHHFSPATLCKLLTRAGFTINRVETFGSFVDESLPGLPEILRKFLAKCSAGVQCVFGKGAVLRIHATKSGSN